MKYIFNEEELINFIKLSRYTSFSELIKSKQPVELVASGEVKPYGNPQSGGFDVFIGKERLDNLIPTNYRIANIYIEEVKK